MSFFRALSSIKRNPKRHGGASSSAPLPFKVHWYSQLRVCDCQLRVSAVLSKPGPPAQPVPTSRAPGPGRRPWLRDPRRPPWLASGEAGPGRRAAAGAAGGRGRAEGQPRAPGPGHSSRQAGAWPRLRPSRTTTRRLGGHQSPSCLKLEGRVLRLACGCSAVVGHSGGTARAASGTQEL
jgi:hypothetical protein